MGLNILRKISCLIIFDNFDTVPQEKQEELFSFLLSVPFPNKILMTKRPCPFSEKNVAKRFFTHPLSGLTKDESLSLILEKSQQFGLTDIQQKIEANSQQIDELYNITHGNPFAIILSVGKIKFSSYALENIISALKSGDQNDLFSYLFSSYWDLLDSLSKKLLIATTLFENSFTKEAISATISQSLDLDIERALTLLIQYSLIQPNYSLTNSEQRFDTHPLTRAFAKSKLNELLKEKEEFYLALAQYFLDFAKRYEVRFWDGYEGRAIYNPLEKERINILGILDWCWNNSKFDIFVEIVKAIANFLIVRGHWELCLVYGEKAVKVSSKEDEKAWILVRLQGYIYANRNNFNQAETSLKKAIKLYRQTENMLGLSESLRNLARVYRKQSDKLELAKTLYDECYKIALETQNQNLIALALNEKGKLQRDKGNLDGAMRLFKMAKKEVSDNSIRSGILCNMAGVAVSLDDLNNAREFSNEALDFFSEIDNQEGIATTKWRLAEIELSQNPKKALNSAQDAYDIFMRLGMKQESGATLKLISTITSELNHQNYNHEN